MLLNAVCNGKETRPKEDVVLFRDIDHTVDVRFEIGSFGSLALERSGEWHGRTIQQSRLSECCGRSRFGCPEARRWGRYAEISRARTRSEEHTSELQSLMRISYAVFCLKKKKQKVNSTRILSTTLQT